VILIVGAYFAPSNKLKDALLERVGLPGRMEERYSGNGAVKGEERPNPSNHNNNKNKNKNNNHQNQNDPRGWKVPVPQETSMQLYENDDNIVHVIHTRFMQFQAPLSDLARARLQLFRTFTLPSVRQQSNQQFLWIIWMEPQLDVQVRQEFIDLVRDLPNCIVIGSRSKQPLMRAEFYAQAVMESAVFSGSYDLLLDYHEAAQSRIVLHTQLDADDALFYDFVRSLQRDAVQSLKHSTLKYDYRIWCVRKRLEWGYFNPLNETAVSGYLVGYESKKECPPGGYTKGYGTQTDEPDLPPEGRYEIHTSTPQCDFTSHKCIARLDGGSSDYAVLRARTPAAHGMTDVLPKTNSPKDLAWKDRQEATWNKLPKNFGVHRTTVEQMRAGLESNMVNIILQNLEGQCSEGFSCKHSSKEKLKQLKAKYKKQQDEEKQKKIEEQLLLQNKHDDIINDESNDADDDEGRDNPQKEDGDHGSDTRKSANVKANDTNSESSHDDPSSAMLDEDDNGD